MIYAHAKYLYGVTSRKVSAIINMHQILRGSLRTKERIVVRAKFALAMKEALGLTWHQDKERRRLWKKVGVSIAGKVIQGGGNGHSGRDEPVALVPDLQKFVKELLDKLDQEGKLTWHDNGIPEDEIWVKIGEDHGRGSLKTCCQVPNTETQFP